uniref:Biotin-dependent carboxyltransferase family protein n=1 Tax=Desulfatirhabdium butyrativorans TaxID=340467 RepID=A0A7C4RUT5_9BACT
MIRILDPGPFATVQDLGRYGYQDRGVPVSGAMDPFSLRVGNVLVGNEAGAAGIEITWGGFEAEFGSNTVFCLTGAQADAQLNGAAIPFWDPIAARTGDRVHIDAASVGARMYLCIAGGLDVPIVMGSRSTYVKAGFGGFEGRALQQGDTLMCGTPPYRPARSIDPKFVPLWGEDVEVRCVFGPQADAFTEEALEVFCSCAYSVTSRSDRMGIALEGAQLVHRTGPDILSDGIVTGAVQVPGDGRPIVLMADRQTTGGYTKIATVIRTDICRMAQVLPGYRIRFKAVDPLEARWTALKEEYRFRRWVESVRSER